MLSLHEEASRPSHDFSLRSDRYDRPPTPPPTQHKSTQDSVDGNTSTTAANGSGAAWTVEKSTQDSVDGNTSTTAANGSGAAWTVEKSTQDSVDGNTSTVANVSGAGRTVQSRWYCPTPRLLDIPGHTSGGPAKPLDAKERDACRWAITKSFVRWIGRGDLKKAIELARMVRDDILLDTSINIPWRKARGNDLEGEEQFGKTSALHELAALDTNVYRVEYADVLAVIQIIRSTGGWMQMNCDGCPESLYPTYCTPLHFAAIMGRPPRETGKEQECTAVVLQALLAQRDIDLDVNIMTQLGGSLPFESPLHTAVRYHNVSSVQLLLQQRTRPVDLQLQDSANCLAEERNCRHTEESDPHADSHIQSIAHAFRLTQPWFLNEYKPTAVAIIHSALIDSLIDPIIQIIQLYLLQTLS